MSEWQDCTSYSRDDKDRKPTSFEIVKGPLRITITCGHIYHRGSWVMHCPALRMDTELMISKTLEDAKQEAVAMVGERLRVLNRSLDIITKHAKGKIEK